MRYLLLDDGYLNNLEVERHVHGPTFKLLEIGTNSMFL